MTKIILSIGPSPPALNEEVFRSFLNLNLEWKARIATEHSDGQDATPLTLMANLMVALQAQITTLES